MNVERKSGAAVRCSAWLGITAAAVGTGLTVLCIMDRRCPLVNATAERLKLGVNGRHGFVTAPISGCITGECVSGLAQRGYVANEHQIPIVRLV